MMRGLVAFTEAIILIAVLAISLLAVVFLAAFAAVILPALIVIGVAAESRHYLEKRQLGELRGHEHRANKAG